MKTFISKIQHPYIKALLLLVSVNFYACEEVINVDLNSASPKPVIEAAVTDQEGPYFVKITKTTDYFNPAENPKVSGATVTISDDMGVTDHLQEVEPGLYQTDSLRGIPGHTYRLKVEMDGHTYLAESTMPKAISIDSITYKPSIGHMGKKTNRYDLTCNFQDIPKEEDFCRIKVIQNGEEVNKIFLFNDRLFDGNYIKYSQIRGGNDFKINDKIKMELWTLDKPTYIYFSTLRDALASDAGNGPHGGGSSPANPVSNLTGGDVLGYFGAYSIRVDSVTIK